MNIFCKELAWKKDLIRKSCLKKSVTQILTGQSRLNISIIFTVLEIAKKFRQVSVGQNFISCCWCCRPEGSLCFNYLLHNCCLELIEFTISFSENSFMVLGLTWRRTARIKNCWINRLHSSSLIQILWRLNFYISNE